MLVGLFLLGVILVLLSFMLAFSRLLNCLIVVENFNVLLLFTSITISWEESRIFFVALMVVFTIEVVVALVVLTRLWDTSGLIGILGW